MVVGSLDRSEETALKSNFRRLRLTSVQLRFRFSDDKDRSSLFRVAYDAERSGVVSS